MNKEKEVRSMIENIEFRSNSEDEHFIEGYALKFGTYSEDLGGFKETILREALDNTDMSDVRALFNHNADHVLARTSAGTLKLSVDDVGLRFKAKIPKTSYGIDLIENIRNGNVNQCSFGFCVGPNGDEIRHDKNENIYLRTLKNIKEILDVSVVTYPAYKDTNVAPALRSIDSIKQNELEKEKLKLELELLK
ncbi:HK97 family phage prohead protease [Abyssicoccus albus]|uniref:HK97 family phage prohead protease n=1 Tax=Abyssicoccus albus TaxID=1817405 RepID=UPI00097E3BD4|nr:HK97 family phage prohead protease [Abyssicoccus albus]AQL56420.1 peptidase U35 [Abyssicoccus albus]